MSKPRPPIHIEPKGWGEKYGSRTIAFIAENTRNEKSKRCDWTFMKSGRSPSIFAEGCFLMTIKESPEAPTTQQFALQAGQCLDILPGLVYQTEAQEALQLFEFSTEHFESDSYRLIKGD